jgi:signal transduction histidine kinase
MKEIFDRKEAKLFVTFYVLSTFIFYTASWISYGAFSAGHPSYFNIEEFLSAAGVQFGVSFLLTIPIYYIVFVYQKNAKLTSQLALHAFFIPIYLICTYLCVLWIKKYFGWVMNWGGYSTVWTFYFLLLFYLVQFGLMHSYSYFKRLKKEETEKTLLREAVLQSQIIALKSQLNPHFLHNLFNSINATIPPENERTRELIVQLSDLFRYQNYASQNEFVTLKEELDFIEIYLELMKIRLKERLNYSIEVTSDLFGLKIIPMLLQPLIENAIIHGIAPKLEPSNLVVRITQIAGKLHFSIEDTGIGFNDRQNYLKRGLGLSNTKLRLNKICESDLIIEDNLPTGTKISFTI